MPSTIRCKHCGRRIFKNPRIKKGQRYCGSGACQRARKNTWEREKIKKDEHYHVHRQETKRRSQKQRQGYLQQRDYRETHPEYVKTNRENQVKRHENTKIIVSGSPIVKTDALITEWLIPIGFYELIPCRTDASGKIVKTDALIVQLSGIQHHTAHAFLNTT